MFTNAFESVVREDEKEKLGLALIK